MQSQLENVVELEPAIAPQPLLAPSPPPATIPRRHDLDSLRAIAMLLGIGLHGALAYIPMPDAGWPIHDRRQSEFFALFLSLIHGFRMPLFFLLSGFFTAMLWRKRGIRELLKNRFKRIFLPLLIGVFTLIPVVWVVIIGTGVRSAAVNQGNPINLWTSVRTADFEAINQRLADGVLIDQWEPASGNTALYVAAQLGNNQIVSHLIDRGANVNARNRDGSTPLHGAVLFEHADTVRLLLKNDANVDAKNRLGETPSQMLSVNGLRLLVTASMSGHEIDPNVDKGEIAALLHSPDAITKSQPDLAGKEPAVGSNDMLMLLLIMFPLFHHLWFLWFLCWLVSAFCVYAYLSGLSTWKPSTRFVVSPWRYAWLIPLTALPQSMMGLMYANFGPDTSTGLLPMPAILFYYAIFFFFGALYFDCDDNTGRLGRFWPVTLPLALLVVFPIGYQLSTGGFGVADATLIDSGWCRPISVVMQVSYAWLMSFGLMGLFRRLLSTERPTMRYLSDSAYWLYLAHLPLVMVIQSAVQDWPIPAIGKLAIVCVTTTGVLLASYQWFVRYTPIGTLLNGPRQRVLSNAAATP